MLRCDNTAFRRLWRAKLRKPRILAAMSDAKDLARRFFALLRGIETYRSHPYRRRLADAGVIWQEGSTRLLDFHGAGVPVLIVPSLTNRYHVLDLLPERSFVRYLADRGVRPLLVDWGQPG